MRTIFATLFILLAVTGMASACPDYTRGSTNDVLSFTDLQAGVQVPVFAQGGFSLPNCGLGTTFGRDLVGVITDAPTYTFEFDGRNAVSLSIEVQSNCAPTLLVNSANGSWFFDDDFGGPNPRLTLFEPEHYTGRVDVWIGNTIRAAPCSASLRLEASGSPAPPPDATCPSFATRGEGWTMNGVQFEDTQAFAVTAQGGEVQLFDCIDLLGGFGTGFTTQGPQFTFDLFEMDGYDLRVEVRSDDCDTTLLVNTSDGQWHFNDDGPIDFDAQLLISGDGVEGRVDIWVGTFDGATCPATLDMQAVASSR